METLSTWITPTAYQIVSFAWKLVQVSEGRQGERAVAVERCNTAQALCLETNHNRLFFFFPTQESAERERRRERSVCWRAQESWFLSPRQCTTLSASHANKSLRKLLAIYTCHRTWHAGRKCNEITLTAKQTTWLNRTKPLVLFLSVFFFICSKNIQHEI